MQPNRMIFRTFFSKICYKSIKRPDISNMSMLSFKPNLTHSYTDTL